MIFTQTDVNQIVAKAKQLGASDGLTYKQGLFSLEQYGTDGNAFDLALCLVNGWDLRDDLIVAFVATSEILSCGTVSTVWESDYNAVFERAKVLGAEVQTWETVPHSNTGEQFGVTTLCRHLVTTYLHGKYDLVYALQALIEHSATAGNHIALRREPRRRLASPLGIAGSIGLAAALSYGAGWRMPCIGAGSPPSPPEPPRDDAWYIKRAEEKRIARAARRLDREKKAAAGNYKNS